MRRSQFIWNVLLDGKRVESGSRLSNYLGDWMQNARRATDMLRDAREYWQQHGTVTVVTWRVTVQERGWFLNL
ncbi:MAG: hypothetical protein M3O31_03000 [Acidobacteriota bacterium]|nr:hypothetical protein [Acidobacteriota bacterium]